MKISTVLRRAKQKVMKGWCQVDSAQNRHGRQVSVYSPAACAWCTTGAIMAATPRTRKAAADAAVHMTVRTQVYAAIWPPGSLEEWNDHPQRTQAEVLAAIEPGMSDAMREINVTAHGRDSNRVLSAIGGHLHGCSYEEVVKQVLPFMSSRIVDEVLKSLVVSGRIVQTTTVGGRHYHVPVYGEGKKKPPAVYLETDED